MKIDIQLGRFKIQHVPVAQRSFILIPTLSIDWERNGGWSVTFIFIRFAVALAFVGRDEPPNF